MASLLTVAIWNAGLATLIGLVAFVVGRWSKNAAVGHALWVLVLVKLVAPPLFVLPLPVLPPSMVDRVNEATESAGVAEVSTPATMYPTAMGKLAAGDVKALPANDAAQAMPLTTKLRNVALSVWLLGILVYGTYQLYVTWQMRRLMQLAAHDNRIDRAMHRIARRAKVQNYPTARVVPWVGSPMLWGLGSTSVIVLPKQLLDNLDEAAAETLMQHELAHFQRGDQWVRILEVVATTLFWWHPIAWLAKQEIELFEEQCCDAWVVRQDQSKRRRYAEALLDTVDFISDAPDSARPVLASGLGRVPLLQKRLKSIMQGRQQLLGTRARAGVLLLVLLVPAQPKLLEASFLSSTVVYRETSNEGLDTKLPQIVASKPDFLSHMKQSLAEKVTNRAPVPEIEYARSTSTYGTYELSASSGNRVRLEAVVTGNLVDLTGFGITSATFAPPGDEAPRFVAGCVDGRVLLFDCETGLSLRTLASVEGGVHSVDFSTDGRWVAVGGADGIVRIMDVVNERQQTLDGSFGPVRCVRFSHDGQRLAVTTDTWNQTGPGRVDIWDAGTKRHQMKLECPAAVGVAGFSDEGQLLTADWNGELTAWSTTGAPVWMRRVPKDAVSAASFSPEAISLQDLVNLGQE